MTASRVAVLRTSPRTVLADYSELMNLAGYRDIVDPQVDTALKINISWHFFYPGSSTTPWQLEGVIRTLEGDGYSPDLIHACHNRTVVIDAHLGERENKHLPVVEAHGLRNIHLYGARSGSTSGMRSVIWRMSSCASTRSTPRASTSLDGSSARTSSTCRRSRPMSSPPPQGR